LSGQVVPVGDRVGGVGANVVGARVVGGVGDLVGCEGDLVVTTGEVVGL